MELECTKTYKFTEKHLYECLYDILKANIPEADKLPALQKYKAKIVQLHARQRAKILDTHTHTHTHTLETEWTKRTRPCTMYSSCTSDATLERYNRYKTPMAQHTQHTGTLLPPS